MAGKIYYKTTVYSLVLLCSCALVPIILSSCMNPVNITVFMESPEVQAIIESNNMAVRVDDKTSHKGLEGRNEKITGLRNDKYYMVEKELDKDGKNVPEYNPNGAGATPIGNYPLFVTDNRPDAPDLRGTLYILDYITKIEGGNIIGLENYHTYTVRDAVSFPNNTAFTYKAGGVAQTPVYVNNGEINITTATTLTLDLTSNLTAGASYEIIAVSGTATPEWDAYAGGANTSKSSVASGWNAIPLEAVGTTVDYVIVNTTDHTKFNFLRVNIVPPATVQFTITLTAGDLITTPTSTTGITLQRGSYDGTKSITLTLAVPTGGGTWDTNSIKWSINPVIDSSLANNHNTSLKITNGGIYFDYGLLAADSFIVSVTATKSGAPYSAKVTINVVN